MAPNNDKQKYFFVNFVTCTQNQGSCCCVSHNGLWHTLLARGALLGLWSRTLPQSSVPILRESKLESVVDGGESTSGGNNVDVGNNYTPRLPTRAHSPERTGISFLVSGAKRGLRRV